MYRPAPACSVGQRSGGPPAAWPSVSRRFHAGPATTDRGPATWTPTWARAEKSRINKTVDFFLMLYRAGSPARHRPDEVDNVLLVPLAEAEGMLTHDGEKAIIRAAERRVRDLSSDGFLAVRDQGARERLIAAVA